MYPPIVCLKFERENIEKRVGEGGSLVLNSFRMENKANHRSKRIDPERGGEGEKRNRMSQTALPFSKRFAFLFFPFIRLRTFSPKHSRILTVF